MVKKPLSELESEGTPSVLNYNVPEPTSYSGRNLIELDYETALFKKLAGKKPAIHPGATVDEAGVRDLLLQSSVTSARLSSHAAQATTVRRAARDTAGGAAGPARAAKQPAADIQVDIATAQAQINQGRVPILVPTQSGNVKVDYAPVPTEPAPAIYLVESYRLSTFLGDYGAGRTIKTFSLLPGEKSTISITTYKSSASTATEASSIFDSYTEDTADSFEEAVQSENSDRETQDKTKSWYVDAEASGNWGVAKASVKGGASGSTNSSREEFARNTTSATQKHASTASAKRDIQVNTSTQTTTTEGEDTAVVRELTNINVGRTLNFVFRQLNQEFITLLHLVDLRVGFFNGYPDTRMEVPLADIDRLLAYCVKEPADRTKIKEDVLYAAKQIRDWTGAVHHNEARPQDPANFIVQRSFVEQSGKPSTFEMVNRQKKSTYAESNITVDGLILAVQKNVIRTDGVIVEALLGEGEGLDGYSRGLQDQAVIEKRLANELTEIQIARERLAQDIARSADAARAEVFTKVFSPPAAGDTESAG